MNDVDLRPVAREICGLLYGAIAAADNCQDLFFEERAITDGAVADAPPGELFFARDTQLAWQPTGRDDDRLANVFGAIVRLDDAPIAARLDRDDLTPGDFDAELADLFLLRLGHRTTGDALDNRVVLDQLRIEQLSATSAHTIEQQGSEPCPAGIQRGGHTRWPGADDDDIPISS